MTNKQVHQHTPTPWDVEVDDPTTVLDADGIPVATCLNRYRDDAEEEAAHIVRCVNAVAEYGDPKVLKEQHDELVAALRELRIAEALDDDDPRLIAARCQTDGLLAKLELS